MKNHSEIDEEPENEERRLSEEAERAKLRELRKVQLCADIYTALAVAAWDGIEVVAVDEEALNFKSDLMAMGLEVSPESECEYANLVNQGLRALLGAAKNLVNRVRKSSPADNALKTLRVEAQKLSRTGSRTTASRMATVSDQICRALLFECERVEKILASTRDSISKYLTDTSIINREIERVNNSLREARLIETEWRQGVDGLVRKIKAHIDDIGSSYAARSNSKTMPTSREEKASALRLAYATHIPDVEFEKFSVNDIINLMRMANDLPLNDLDVPDCYLYGNRLNAERMQDQLDGLKIKYKRVAAQMGVANKDERVVMADMERLHTILAMAKSVQMKSHEFTELIKSTLNGVGFGDLKFDAGEYIGPCLVRLAAARTIVDERLKTAHKELQWLLSESGRNFSVYLDTVFSELAKQGERNVDLVFAERGIANRIEVGSVSFVCEIGSTLFALLLRQRGIVVQAEFAIDGQTIFRLSW